MSKVSVKTLKVFPPCVVCAGEKPTLDWLWFGHGPEVTALRLTSFLSVFDCRDFSRLHGDIEDSMLTALCLVTYIALQVAPHSFWTLLAVAGLCGQHKRERK